MTVCVECGCNPDATDRHLRETVRHELVMERAASLLLQLLRRFDGCDPYVTTAIVRDVEELHAELVYPQACFENTCRNIIASMDAQNEVLPA